MIPFLRCDVCGRATSTYEGEVKALEVCWDVERNQQLCMRCYQSPAAASRPTRPEALAMRREKGKTL